MATAIDENKNRHRVLYGIVSVLIFVVLLQGGFLIYNLQNQNRLNAQLENLLLSPKEKIKDPAQFTHHPRRTISRWPVHTPSITYDPFWSDPFTTMNRLQARMNRMFDEMFDYDSFMPGAMRGSVGSSFLPSVDLEEQKDAYIARIDLPGLDKNKINISLNGNLLTIQGAREHATEAGDEDSGYYAQERSYGSFARALTLPGPVQESQIEASYKDGVLTVKLPKKTDAKNMQAIQIK